MKGGLKSTGAEKAEADRLKMQVGCKSQEQNYANGKKAKKQRKKNCEKCYEITKN